MDIYKGLLGAAMVAGAMCVGYCLGRASVKMQNTVGHGCGCGRPQSAPEPQERAASISTRASSAESLVYPLYDEDDDTFENSGEPDDALRLVSLPKPSDFED